MNLFEREAVGDQIIEMPEILHGAEKAADDIGGERCLQSYAEIIGLRFGGLWTVNQGAALMISGLAFQTAQRAQGRKNQNQIGQQTDEPKFGGNLQIRVVGHLFANRIDVEIAHADADEQVIGGNLCSSGQEFAARLR